MNGLMQSFASNRAGTFVRYTLILCVFVAVEAGADPPNDKALVEAVEQLAQRARSAYGVKQYTKAIEEIDMLLAPLLHAVETRRTLGEDWLVLLTTDHGGTARSDLDLGITRRFDGSDLNAGISQKACDGIHGLDIPQHRTTFFLACYASRLAKGEIVPAPRNFDITPTVLEHLELQHVAPMAGAPRGFGCSMSETQ